MVGQRLSFMEQKILSCSICWFGKEASQSFDECKIKIIFSSSVSMKKAIEEGKSPGIRISGRTWNDESSGTIIEMDSPAEVSIQLYFSFYFISINLRQLLPVKPFVFGQCFPDLW